MQCPAKYKAVKLDKYGFEIYTPIHPTALPDGALLSPTDTRKELVLKATKTGVTFLGDWNEEYKKYISERAYKKRYVGSKQSAVDSNGVLWLDSKELDADIKAARKDKPTIKKKRRMT